MSADERLLDQTTLGVREDDVAIVDLLAGAGGDDLVGYGDAFPHEVVDGLAELLLGFRLGRVDVDLADLELQPADGVAHRDR